MATKFEQFEQLYAQMATYAQAQQRAGDSSNIGQNLRNLITQGTAEYTNDPALIASYQSSTNAALFMTGFERLAAYKRTDANDIAKQDRVGLLESTPEGYLEVAIESIKPKDSYTGANAEFANRVAGLQKRVIELTSKDEEGIKKAVSEYYKAQYDTKDEKQKRALELTEALIEVEPAIMANRYETFISEAGANLNQALDTKGKKAMYVDANIEGDDFIKHFESTMEAMQRKMAAQQQQQSQARQAPRNGGRRTSGPRRRHP